MAKYRKWEFPETPSLKEAKASVDRAVINKCPNCGRPHSIGQLGRGTHIEVKCSNSDCKMFYYLTVL